MEPSTLLTDLYQLNMIQAGFGFAVPADAIRGLLARVRLDW
jgi:hypothetical protein